MANTKNKTKYRYIACGVVSGTDPISEYRLLAKNQLNGFDSVIRVPIPDGMDLKRWNGYSHTDDNRTLDELEYDVMINFNGRWKIRNDLKGTQPHKFYDVLTKDGYHITKDGYLTEEEYRNYMAKLNRKLNEDSVTETTGPIWNSNNDGEIIFEDSDCNKVIHADTKYYEALIRKAIELEIRPGARMVKFFKARELPIRGSIYVIVRQQDDVALFFALETNIDMSSFEHHLIVRVRSGSYFKDYTVVRDEFNAEAILLDFEKSVEEALPFTDKFKTAYLDHFGRRVVLNITDKNNVSFTIWDKLTKLACICRPMDEINGLNPAELLPTN